MKIEEVLPYCHVHNIPLKVYGYQYYESTKVTIYRCPVDGCSSTQVVTDYIRVEDRVY